MMNASFTQIVAWSTMLPQQLLKTNSIEQAIENTFNGEHACALCKISEAQRKQGESQEEENAPTQVKKGKDQPNELSKCSWPMSLVKSKEYFPLEDTEALPLYLSVSSPPPRGLA